MGEEPLNDNLKDDEIVENKEVDNDATIANDLTISGKYSSKSSEIE